METHIWLWHSQRFQQFRGYNLPHECRTYRWICCDKQELVLIQTFSLNFTPPMSYTCMGWKSGTFPYLGKSHHQLWHNCFREPFVDCFRPMPLYMKLESTNLTKKTRTDCPCNDARECFSTERNFTNVAFILKLDGVKYRCTNRTLHGTENEVQIGLIFSTIQCRVSEDWQTLLKDLEVFIFLFL